MKLSAFNLGFSAPIKKKIGKNPVGENLDAWFHANIESPHKGAWRLCLYDVDSGKCVFVSQPANFGSSMAISESRDGKTLYVSTFTGSTECQLHKVDMTNGAVEPLYTLMRAPRTVTFSKDASALYVCGHESSEGCVEISKFGQRKLEGIPRNAIAVHVDGDEAWIMERYTASVLDMKTKKLESLEGVREFFYPQSILLDLDRAIISGHSRTLVFDRKTRKVLTRAPFGGVMHLTPKGRLFIGDREVFRHSPIFTLLCANARSTVGRALRRPLFDLNLLRMLRDLSRG